MKFAGKIKRVGYTINRIIEKESALVIEFFEEETDFHESDLKRDFKQNFEDYLNMIKSAKIDEFEFSYTDKSLHIKHKESENHELMAVLYGYESILERETL